MRRLMIVYTLSGQTDEREVIEQLVKTQDMLPQGAFQQICRRHETGMDEKLNCLPFGDLVQMIDFVKTSQAEEFAESDAAKDQRKRTRGMFSNTAAISCTVTEG